MLVKLDSTALRQSPVYFVPSRLLRWFHCLVKSELKQQVDTPTLDTSLWIVFKSAFPPHLSMVLMMSPYQWSVKSSGRSPSRCSSVNWYLRSISSDESASLSWESEALLCLSSDSLELFPFLSCSDFLLDRVFSASACDQAVRGYLSCTNFGLNLNIRIIRTYFPPANLSIALWPD